MRLRKLVMAMIVVIGIFNFEYPAIAQSNMRIQVNLWTHSLSIFHNNTAIKKFKIASGKDRTPTPIGHFKIINKAKEWGGGFGTRWLELNVPWGVYGIHGTNRPYLIGKNVSHGCIRMKNKDVEWLYTHIPIGTPVDVIGPIKGLETHIVLAVGSKGTLVYLIQQRLKSAGYYSGVVNGYFNVATEHAIENFQKDHHLIVTGHGNQRLYMELGLLE